MTLKGMYFWWLKKYVRKIDVFALEFVPLEPTKTDFEGLILNVPIFRNSVNFGEGLSLNIGIK